MGKEASAQREIVSVAQNCGLTLPATLGSLPVHLNRHLATRGCAFRCHNVPHDMGGGLFAAPLAPPERAMAVRMKGVNFERCQVSGKAWAPWGAPKKLLSPWDTTCLDRCAHLMT